MILIMYQKLTLQYTVNYYLIIYIVVSISGLLFTMVSD